MTKKADKVQELETRVNELEALLKRAVADYRNLEKRVQEGRSELTRWGTNDLITRILPTLDHLEQALSGVSEEEKQSGWVKGVELAVKQLYQVLQTEGLEQIEATGQFDPNLHEAVDTQQGDDNIILKVVRKGFRLNGRVLRPAQVIVGKKNPPTMEETENLPGGETQSDINIPPQGEKE